MQKMKENGEHINTLKEDCRELVNRRFHVTLLALPTLGVILANVIPIIFMICIAFTNYDMNHQPPTYLFTWVGLENFRQLFTTSATVTFGYAFIRILFWTLLWAVLATFTTYFGGIMLAKLINDRQVRWKKMWRTLFVVTIAIPQFVTLLLIGKMFGDYGIVNSFCSKIGLTDLLKQIGLVGKGLSYIPFLTKPGWAHVMIVLINIWVGVPFQMLSDGYRNVIKIILDIATRMCILNPYLKGEALKKTSGIVLIDEVDLSLHPTWQKRIMGILKEQFPRIQFICATHSPFIIQSLEEGELITLDHPMKK